MLSQRALVRRPSPDLAKGLLTHLARQPIDLALARQQARNYAETLNAAGWAVIEAPPADDSPDSVFIEDTLVAYSNLAVVTRPGAPERRREVPGAEVAVRALGYRTARILAPGTLDGGDVLKHDNLVWVGVGGRTNEAGFEQLAALLTPLGATVVPVELTKVLHLKSAVTALPDGTVIGYEPLVDDPGVFPRFLGVEEPEGAHVVLLNHNRLLMAASAPRTAQSFRDRGFEVLSVDISEFEKLEGCVTCLSVRLRGL
ncbi:MAG: N(G),N(G)-dimethylarginine dimethylaminohydrolase [Micropruina sp.]|nr:N(G),N(G)-dimethylarginine dimethylaminohydrolase [Micropruina sp.]